MTVFEVLKNGRISVGGTFESAYDATCWINNNVADDDNNEYVVISYTVWATKKVAQINQKNLCNFFQKKTWQKQKDMI